MSDQSSAPPSKPRENDITQLQALLRAPAPRIYANGLGTLSGPTDVAIIFLNHDTPAAIVNMSYSTAKSLVKDLSGQISQYEKQTNQVVLDIVSATQRIHESQKK
jgi:hypothetical protein